LYFKSFNAWATGDPIGQLRFAGRDPLPAIATLGTAPVGSASTNRQAVSA